MALDHTAPLGGATLALIKPDAFGAGHANDIVQLTLNAGFTVLSQRTMQVFQPDIARFVGSS